MRYECRYSVMFYFFLVLFMPLTLGIGTIGLLISSRQWPRLVDAEGITLRSGMRIPWSACTNVVKLGMRTDLVFGGTTIPFPQLSIRNGKKILADIRERLGVGPG